MKNDLTLNIGTRYNGDGMKKLESAMKTAGTQAKSASRAINGVTGALGGLGGEAGKVAGQLGNVVQAFSQIGIAGGIIAVGTMAI